MESIIKHKAVKRLLELKQKMLSKIICESQRKTEYPKSENGLEQLQILQNGIILDY